ncbi:double zinc ribbon domain-containing protein [Halobaculum rubrum]|uniref:double zinc ribbon domain-containing protein n=1 Tax=Halobaculum rubrum TaxID=2872158 RepID=UPI001CA3B9D4|nr:zinc ribbon domain-containing protein [Halobaculum rubrum]QZY00406.1 zinc ribbon domain-containing protein [Halobaculum rubrum]
MSKITFRADADLVDRLERLEGSKSEVMREALREHLDAAEEQHAADAADASDTGTRSPSGAAVDTAGSLDDALAARVDELVTARLDEEFGTRRRATDAAVGGARPFGVPGGAGDRVPSVNLTVNVDGAGAAVDPSAGVSQPASADAEPAATATEEGPATEGPRSADAASEEGPATEGPRSADAASDAGERSCAQCGEDLSDDHVFCPNCGEKATRRLFCECGDEIRSDWGFCPGCGRRTPAADVLDAP